MKEFDRKKTDNFENKERHDNNSFLNKSVIVAGRNPVKEAIMQQSGLDRILISRQANGEVVREIKSLANEFEIPIQIVPVEKLNRMTNVQHQGIVAIKSSIRYWNVQDIIDQCLSEGKIPFFALLDGITDTRNIGAISRSALCMGVDAIIIPERGVGAIQEDAIKASAGALEIIKMCRINDWETTINLLKLNGFKIWTSLLESDNDIETINFDQPTAIILGAEGKGVQDELKTKADDSFKIKMFGNFDSLNVSVAAGLIFYHIGKAIKK